MILNILQNSNEPPQIQEFYEEHFLTRGKDSASKICITQWISQDSKEFHGSVNRYTTNFYLYFFNVWWDFWTTCAIYFGLFLDFSPISHEQCYLEVRP